MNATMPREQKPTLEPRPAPPPSSWWIGVPREQFSDAIAQRQHDLKFKTPTHGQRHKDGV